MYVIRWLCRVVPAPGQKVVVSNGPVQFDNGKVRFFTPNELSILNAIRAGRIQCLMGMHFYPNCNTEAADNGCAVCKNAEAEEDQFPADNWAQQHKPPGGATAPPPPSATPPAAATVPPAAIVPAAPEAALSSGPGV